MKLGRKESHGSFHESFSDLMFSTLKLFIILVIGMSLDLKSASSEARAKAADLVSLSRFTGGAGRTYAHITYIPVKGRVHVAWIPASIANDWDLVTEGEKIDAAGQLAVQYLSADGVPVMTLEQFFAMQDGLSWAVVDGMIINYEHGQALHLMRGAEQILGGRWTPQRLRDAIGGIDLNRADARLGGEIASYRAFVGDGERLMREGDLELRRRLDGRRGEPPTIRFSATEDRRIRVGRCEMSAGMFRGVLRAVEPGSKFYVEYVDSTGAPAEAPAWVVREVLSAVGFDGRTLTDEARDRINNGG